MTWSLPNILRRAGRRTLSRQRSPLRPVEPLEDRVCPVIGAFDIPGPIGAGDGLRRSGPDQASPPGRCSLPAGTC